MKRKQSLSLVIFITLFLLLEQAYCFVDPQYEACAPKRCGNQNITFPFRIKDEHEAFCGYPGFDIVCRENRPIIRAPEEDSDLVIQQIFYKNHSVHVFSPVVLNLTGNCLPDIQSNFSLDRKFKFVSSVSDLFLFYNCSGLTDKLERYKIKKCREENSSGLAIFGGDENLRYAVVECNRSVMVPVGKVGNGEMISKWGELEEKVGILVHWTASDCSVCVGSGGRCGFDLDSHLFKCYCPDRPHSAKCHHNTGKSHLKLILALVVPIPLAIIFSSILCIVFCRKKWKVVSPFIRRNISFDPFSKADFEGRNVCFEVPLYSYAELQEATKNFAESEELGDGGFGTVYYGKLKDGREVAVKRLYDHNYKRVSQFINETEILTRIRHRNLVSLYGCTSSCSQELLLVYEYIPNGTVADHLNGDRSKDGSLTWPMRMNIAIETASALVYLHASDIIHRDVKTTNILLDKSFCVKVADFGLSRLLPTDVTHVSTAPQGTPGYVDPEYHQCYQLTDKSDVYSFGVVLVELISSMPAVDISRHRHEINLANLAINKIQSRALSDLVDPSLGFYSDPSIRRMITSVAEVAFRCLQLEKEMRPTMDEVYNTLKEILEYRDEKIGEGIDNPRSGDDILLLKNHKALPPSPDSVTSRWIVSSSDTSICSG